MRDIDVLKLLRQQLQGVSNRAGYKMQVQWAGGLWLIYRELGSTLTGSFVHENRCLWVVGHFHTTLVCNGIYFFSSFHTPRQASIAEVVLDNLVLSKEMKLRFSLGLRDLATINRVITLKQRVFFSTRLPGTTLNYWLLAIKTDSYKKNTTFLFIQLLSQQQLLSDNDFFTIKHKNHQESNNNSEKHSIR